VITRESPLSDRQAAVRDYAKAMTACAERLGLVVTIHLEPQKPLAMRNYRPVIEITEKR
jgi:hypothetical protein